MARMPQIPAVNYDGRPGGEVERATLPTGGGGGEELGQLANMTENIAGVSQRRAVVAQAQLDAVNKQKQAVTDSFAAAKAEGDYRLKVGQVYNTLQKQYWNKPDSPQFQEDLTAQLNAAADEAQANPDMTPGVALHMARAAGSINAQVASGATRWSQIRSTKLAKSNLTGTEDGFVQSVGSIYSPESLALTMKDAHQKLDPLYDKAASDPQKAKDAFDARMMSSWAETQSAAPHGAFGVMAALTDKSSVLQKLNPAVRAQLMAKAEKSFQGGGVTAQVNALSVAHQDISDVLGLVANSDPGYPAASLAKRQKIDQDIETTQQDHTIPEAARAGRVQTLKTSQEILGVVDSMYRSNPGVFKQKVDPQVTGDLLARAKAPWMKDDGVGDHLQDMLDLRRDAAKAHQAGTLSTRGYEAIETKLQLALPKAEGAQDTGRYRHVGDGVFDWRSPVQAGNARMAGLLDPKGAYGSIPQEVKNEAWVSYFQQLNDAHKAGKTVTNALAQQMAGASLEYARSMGAR